MKRKVSLALAAVLCMAASVPSFADVKFSDENDVIYEDRDYCEKYKDHYLNEIDVQDTATFVWEIV